MTCINIYNTNNESMMYYDVIYIHKQNGRKNKIKMDSYDDGHGHPIQTQPYDNGS